MNTFALVLGIAFCGSLQAQTIWRCSVDGRTVYTDEACAEGRSLAAGDSRTPEQVAEARRVAQGDAQRAQRMVQQRLAAEREHGTGLIAIGSADRDLFKRSTTLSKKHKKSAKRASKHPEEASTSPSAARATRQTRG